jgi:hypothetical protein
MDETDEDPPNARAATLMGNFDALPAHVRAWLNDNDPAVADALLAKPYPGDPALFIEHAERIKRIILRSRAATSGRS